MLGSSLTRAATLVCVAALPLASLARDTDFKHRDEVFRHGYVSWVSRNNLGGIVFTTTESIAYASDGRYLHRIEEPSGARLGQGASAQTIVASNDWLYYEDEYTDGRVEVVFPKDGKVLRADDPIFFMTEGPCFPLAAGLGQMTNISVDVTETGSRLRGEWLDGSKLTVYFAEGQSELPIRLERSLGKGIVNTWEFSGRLIASDNTLVPKVASFKGGPITRVFEVSRINLRAEPKDEELETKWFREGVTIDDRRVEPWVYWTYKDLKSAVGDGPMDPLILLELSRQRSQGFQKNENLKRQQVAAQSRENNNRIIWFLGVLIGTFVVVFTVLKLFAKSR